MKKILTVFVVSLLLYGCGGSGDEAENTSKNSETATATESNIEISLGESVWNMTLPKTWEKLKAFPEKGVIFLAREGTQNIAISHEAGFTENISERLLKTLQDSLSMVEVLSEEGDTLIFRGKLSATTPMREFYQKVVPIAETGKFLLISCSQEVANLQTLNCPAILDSIYLIGEAA